MEHDHLNTKWRSFIPKMAPSVSLMWLHICSGDHIFKSTLTVHPNVIRKGLDSYIGGLKLGSVLSLSHDCYLEISKTQMDELSDS